MKTQRLFFALLILPLCVFCQNTTLRPEITNQGYCFDSTQVREIARLSVHEKVKDTLIHQQDSLIQNYKVQIACYDTLTTYQDSVIQNKSLIIQKKDEKIKLINKNCTVEKDIIKTQHKKTKKKLFIVIIAEAVLILGLAFVK
jgi:hypothetical protein